MDCEGLLILIGADEVKRGVTDPKSGHQLVDKIQPSSHATNGTKIMSGRIL